MPVVARDFVSRNFDSGAYIEVSVYVRAPDGSTIDASTVNTSIQTAAQSVSDTAVTLPAAGTTATATPLDQTQLQGAGTPTGDGVAPADVNAQAEAKAIAQAQAASTTTTAEPEAPAKAS